WYADPTMGIVLYEFDRVWKGGTYTMLHLVMEVKRHDPPFELRVPGVPSPVAKSAYSTVARKVLQEPERKVDLATIDQPALQADLDKVFARRKKYLEAE